jgi:hypothetical protein
MLGPPGALKATVLWSYEIEMIEQFWWGKYMIKRKFNTKILSFLF